jgi:uncharacterized protein (TIGR02680 family)
VTGASPQLSSDLPQPGRPRWQPLRLGLVELFHYDTEEMWFRDGHLLLRGGNGTGKSKVLALTLPFLLDGDASPHRVEPDGDPKKRMEWNLLLGGRHDERLGYAWIEFGRLDPAAGPRFTTVLCGMKAAAGAGIADRWFAVTDQRMGESLHLVDASGIVLAKDRLREALADRGVLLTRAEDHRRVVNERLFGLDQARYDALLALLVQLRQPQLSKRPDMAALDRALTEALPPLSTAVVADVAEAMRTLERERSDLADLQQARAAVTAFDRVHRHYARVATVRRADEVRSRTAAYEEAGRRLGAAQRAAEEATAAAEQAAVAEAGLRRRTAELEERARTLRASPEMRDAARLDEARRRAADTAAAAEGAARRLAEAADQLAERRRRATTADAARAEAAQAVDVAVAAVRAHAAAAGVGPDVDAQLDPALDAPAGRAVDADVDVRPPGTLPDRPPTAFADLVRRRGEAIAHVAGLDRAAERTRAAAADAQRRLDDAASATEAAAEGRARAGAERTAVRDGWLAAVEAAAAAWQVLPRAGLDRALDEAAAWTDDLVGPDPVAAFAAAADRAVQARLAEGRAALGRRRRDADAAVADLHAERDALQDGVLRGPDPSPTRPAEGRTDRPGAPLWQLVDFAGDLDDDQRAGLEAALEGAGLLDAWVTPDGGLLRPDTLDAAVVPPPVTPTSSLGQVLRPTGTGPDGAAPAVGDDVVRRVLAGIGLGAATADTWVEPTGRFRIGVTEGAWAKPAAAVIGWAAQEAARARRLAEVEAALADLAATLEGIAAELAELDRQAAVAAEELAAVPPDAPVRQAAQALVRAQDRLADLEAARAQAAAEAEAAVRVRDAALAALRDAAEALAVPAEPAARQQTADALQQLQVAAAGLWPAAGRLQQAAADLAVAAADVEHAARVEQDRRVEAERATADAEAAATVHRTLQEMVGTSVQAVLQALADTERERDETTARAEVVREERAAASTRAARAEGQVELLAAQHAAERERRAEAVDALRRLVATGLVDAAVGNAIDRAVALPNPDQPWAAEPGVRLARDLRQVLPDVEADDGTWDRATSRGAESLTDLQRTLAGQGARAGSQTRDGVLLVDVRYGTRTWPVHELGGVLDTQIEDRRRLLDAREQQILEEHLVTEIAAQLAGLIGDAERQVARMNAELQDRPTSTGMVLRLRWQPDPAEGPAGLEEALRRLLRQSSGAWTEEDRRALGSFLQAEIQRCRAADEAGTWTEHLTRAFDYRRWHRFVVERKAGDGVWRRADGPASGGERVLAVTVPLFAAASAHYGSAGPHAPRLVLLDEAFAGVDDAARRQCLGLLATFDLDYVLTSEREWGCYPEVPGLSICHLVRRDDVDAVHVSRWTWDGAVQQRADRPADSAREAVPQQAPVDEGLFG